MEALSEYREFREGILGALEAGFARGDLASLLALAEVPREGRAAPGASPGELLADAAASGAVSPDLARHRAVAGRSPGSRDGSRGRRSSARLSKRPIPLRTTGAEIGGCTSNRCCWSSLSRSRSAPRAARSLETGGPARRNRRGSLARESAGLGVTGMSGGCERNLSTPRAGLPSPVPSSLPSIRPRAIAGDPKGRFDQRSRLTSTDSVFPVSTSTSSSFSR
jgi:hypothetical protein